MKFWIFISLFFIYKPVLCQWTERFDADWAADWSGQTGYWEIVNGELKSKGPAQSGTCLEISRSVSAEDSFELVLVANLKMATSSNNYLQLDLLNQDTGLRLVIGDLKDHVRLEKRSGSNSIVLLQSQDKILQSSTSNPLAIRLRSIGDSLFFWLNTTGDTASFDIIGKAQSLSPMPATLTLRACYSSSNADKFFIGYLRFSAPLFDRVAPQIKSAAAYRDGNVVFQFSEKMDTALGEIKGDDGKAHGMYWRNAETCSIHLFLDSSEEFQVQSFRDLTGNVLVDTLIRIYPEPNILKQLQITEFMRDPTPSLGLPEIEWMELMNTGEYPIELATLLIGDDKNNYGFPPYLLQTGERVLLAATGACTVIHSYGPCLELEIPASFLSNGEDEIHLLNSIHDTLDFLHYDASWNLSEGGISMEKMDLVGVCVSPKENFQPSLDNKGGTPGSINSNYGLWMDTLAPQILELYSPDGKTMHFRFSEEPRGNFQMMLDSISCQVEKRANYFEAILPFVLPDDARHSYSILFSGVSDCSGNRLKDSSLEYRYASLFIPERKDLMLSEVFWNVLPNQQAFIEIFNRGDRAITLAGMNLTIDNKDYPIDKGVLFPGEALLICNPGESGYFIQGLKLEMDARMKFGHRGNIRLSHPVSGLLDEVSYRTNLFGEEWLDKPGFSMEREDTSLLCGYPRLWKISAHAGGTPGLATKLRAEKAEEFWTSLTWDITPSGMLMAETNVPVGNDPVELECSLYPGLQFLSKSGAGDYALLFEGPFPRNTTFQFRIIEGMGCNQEKPENNWMELHANSNSGLRLNEIMYAPLSGRSEFVELFNAGDSAVEINGMYLADCTSSGTPDIPVLITSASIRMEPGTFIVLTDQEHELDRYYPVKEYQIIRLPTFPSFSNSGSCVVLYDSNLRVVDSFYYLPAMHDASLLNTNGVSLERINPYFTGPQSSNWVSASALAHYATPGARNSQFSGIPEQNGEKWELYSGTFSPDGDGYEDHALLQYSNLKPGTRADIDVYSPSGTLLFNWENNTLVGSSGMLRWEGSDKEGNPLPNGAYILLIRYTAPGERTKAKRLVLVKAGST